MRVMLTKALMHCVKH